MNIYSYVVVSGGAMFKRNMICYVDLSRKCGLAVLSFPGLVLLSILFRYMHSKMQHFRFDTPFFRVGDIQTMVTCNNLIPVAHKSSWGNAPRIFIAC